MIISSDYVCHFYVVDASEDASTRRLAQAYLAELGLELGATFEEARSSYRRLARAWHPDRFGQDSAAAMEAAERLRTLIAAFDWLRSNPQAWIGQVGVNDQPRPHSPSREQRSAGTGLGNAEAKSSGKPPAGGREPGRSEARGYGWVGLVAFGVLLSLAIIAQAAVSASINARPTSTLGQPSPSARRAATPDARAVVAASQPASARPSNAVQEATRPPQPSIAEQLRDAIAAFERADSEINRVYQEVRALAPEELFIELRDAQRVWIPGRDIFAEQYTEIARGAAVVGTEHEKWPEFWEARTWRTEARTEYLQGWLNHFNESFQGAGDWSGFWVDSNGGGLYIHENEPSRLEFVLLVVRGPSFHLGQVEGVASVSGESAKFEIVDDDLGVDGGLTFERVGPVLVVSVDGDLSALGGARSYFHGTYSRVDVLSDQKLLLIERALTDPSYSPFAVGY